MVGKLQVLRCDSEGPLDFQYVEDLHSNFVILNKKVERDDLEKFGSLKNLM